MLSGASNGVRSQALTWYEVLSSGGIEVVLMNNWESYNWSEFSAVHIFGYDEGIVTLVKAISVKNVPIYLSPIIDSNKDYRLYKIATLLKISKLRLFTLNSALRAALPFISGVCVRSLHERKYFELSFRLDPARIFHIPLSISVDFPLNRINYQKEDFCLHISSIYQDRKNVMRLIAAAKKYKFRLILAGNCGTDEQFEPIRQAIGGNPYIKVLGFISEEEKLNLYQRAKIFALPSLLEGVGIVALDAAYFGCNVVITRLGGPKDYFESLSNVRFVNPYSIDEIGISILDLMENENCIENTDLIYNSYSKSVLFNKLIQLYN